MAENKARPLRRLLRNASAEDRGLFGLTALYTLCAVVSPALPVLLSGLAVATLTGPAPRAEQLLVIVGVFFLAGALCAFLKEWLMDLAKPRITALRIDYVRQTAVKMVRMDYRHVESASFYEKWEQALNATSGNDNGVEGVYHKLFQAPELTLLCLLLSAFLALAHPLIPLLILAHAGLLLWLRLRAQRYAYRRQGDLNRESRKVWNFGQTAQDFSCGKDIRLYGLLQPLQGAYRRVIGDYMAVLRAINNRQYALELLALPLMLASDLVTFGLLARNVQGGLPIAQFAMFLPAALTLAAKAGELADHLAYIRRESRFVADFYRLMDQDLGDRGGELPAPDGEGGIDIRFEDVTFRYPESERDVLRQFSLHIPAGQRLAIVGVNGAGKSTLVKLLMGFYQPDGGRILIEGQPVQAYRKDALYGLFSAVFQEVEPLAFTLAQNVAGSERFDRARVETALRDAGLWEKVCAQKEGMDSMMLKVIDEDGVMLSGGEQQKLAIARALYKGGRCVVMDEPTAALDALAERDIYASFDALTQGRTAIYISHRLASTQFCDKIALIGEEGLMEYGSHDELMRKGGAYREMFLVQGKYYQEEAV